MKKDLSDCAEPSTFLAVTHAVVSVLFIYSSRFMTALSLLLSLDLTFLYINTHKKILSDAHNMSTMSIHNAMVVLIREHTPIIIVPVKGVNSWNH